MEKIATDIYTFSELRKNGFTYVDKTDALSKKRITLVGISFSSEKRAVVDDLEEEFENLERKST